MSKVLLNSSRELHVDTVQALFMAIVMPLLFPFYVVLTGNFWFALGFFLVAAVFTQGLDYWELRRAIRRKHLFSPWWILAIFFYYLVRDKSGFPNFKLFYINGFMVAISLFLVAFII